MNRSSSKPRPAVPFLPEKRIEDEAALLLAEYAEKHGPVDVPPIPIDEIIELHLELAFELADLQQMFQHPDVHGALWVNERRVGVDQSLDPSLYPQKLGRFRYTLAHEGAHWRLHRPYYLKDPNQGLLVADAGKPAYICRSSDKSPAEWQADFFAANLLMPRQMVYAEWLAWRGDVQPVALDDFRSAEVARANGCTDEEMMEDFCRPLALKFEVSPMAMRIRLEQLALMTREKVNLLF
jgi:hypothetical protein